MKFAFNGLSEKWEAWLDGEIIANAPPELSADELADWRRKVLESVQDMMPTSFNRARSGAVARCPSPTQVLQQRFIEVSRSPLAQTLTTTAT